VGLRMASSFFVLMSTDEKLGSKSETENSCCRGELGLGSSSFSVSTSVPSIKPVSCLSFRILFFRLDGGASVFSAFPSGSSSMFGSFEELEWLERMDGGREPRETPMNFALSSTPLRSISRTEVGEGGSSSTLLSSTSSAGDWTIFAVSISSSTCARIASQFWARFKACPSLA